MIFAQASEYAAVLDACVLVPAVLCDTLLRLAEEPATYRPFWSEHIMAELARALETKLHRTPEEISYRQSEMNKAFPEAMVRVPASLAGGLECIPDEGDKPVLAAAIVGHANVIVTQNTKHFPMECLDPYGILCQSADDFLIHQFTLSEQIVLDKLDDQAAAIARDRSYVIAGLRKCAPGFVQRIEEFVL